MSYLAVATSSATNERSTPGWLVDQLAAEFGPFTLDPAATPENAKAPAYFTREDDGLAQPWHAPSVFVNPPYGRTISAWIGKAIAEVASGNAGLVVALLTVRADTAWWRTAAGSASLVRWWPRVSGPFARTLTAPPGYLRPAVAGERGHRQRAAGDPRGAGGKASGQA